MAWKLQAPSKKAAVASTASSSAALVAEENLPVCRRDYYLEHPAVSALTAAQVDARRAALHIKVHGGTVPNPVASFVQASFPQYILDVLAAANFTAPTPIQQQAWPVAMSGRDMVGLAETGSGKTLAYLLPALVHVNAQPIAKPGDGPLALMLAPTRELALQIHEESVRFGHPCGVRSACIVGGLPKGPQVQQLRKAPEVVIATPGRLNDLLAARRTELTHCTYLVLDEADRMLDLGFEPQIRAVLVQMRVDRQSLLFSATWPVEVQALAHRHLLPDAITVEVGGALTSGGRANARIEQRVRVCESEAAKLPALVNLLEELMDDGVRLLIFCSSKRRCEDLTRALRIDGWPALALHGDKPQEERDWALQEFKEGTNPLLIATDVAQRGLDIKDVRCVVNFDCPASGEAYVHRIGRTGRAGSSGSAFTLLTSEDARVATELIKVLKGASQPVPEELERLAAAAPHKWR
jgi:ATP-dependent RNA helicase DDX5/DBP2